MPHRRFDTQSKTDDFVKTPISALRFISLSLRRTISTPRETRFARLELGLFTKSSQRVTFYEFIRIDTRCFMLPECINLPFIGIGIYLGR
jgi:hypothetical protein